MWRWSKITHTILRVPKSPNVFVEKWRRKENTPSSPATLADNNCVTRSKSFHQVIDQYPDMVSVARQDASGTLIDGKRIKRIASCRLIRTLSKGFLQRPRRSGRYRRAKSREPVRTSWCRHRRQQ